jgi:nicotinamide phosphoribosyltransferase
MRTNLLLNTDSYKASHWLQYPPGTEYVYSYIESRGGEYKNTVFFGLQAFVKEYLTKPITLADIHEASEFWKAHGEPFNLEGWLYIHGTHNGYLPVRIQAAPEGLVIPNRNALVTIVNTDPKCFWLTSYLETAMLRSVWYPTTVATISHGIKQTIRKYLELTGDVAGLPFKLHDFGARGVSSQESAALGGMAHLINFMGSDTVAGVLAAKEYYNEPMAGFSIPAAEHSTITTWGKNEAGETAAYRNMIKRYAKPGGIFAVVSDSYDIFNACEKIWGEKLRYEVQNCGSMVVIRPDSGDPVSTVLRVAKILASKFGVTVNAGGYKVLNNVRIIQGDGVNPKSIEEILQTLRENGFSADNIAFGMGGALLQHMNRDTLEFAMKASAIQINGVWNDVSKNPVNMPEKNSKGGRFKLTYEDGKYWTLPIECKGEDLLQVVFENGKIIREMTFSEVRANSTK